MEDSHFLLSDSADRGREAVVRILSSILVCLWACHFERSELARWSLSFEAELVFEWGRRLLQTNSLTRSDKCDVVV